MKDKNIPALFADCDTDVGKYIKAALDSCTGGLKAKTDQLDATSKEKPKYVGTLGHVSGARLAEKFCDVAELAWTDEVGAEAWCTACVQNSKRADASRVPLRGFAALFSALDQAFVVYSCPIADILEKGVSWEDMENWLESDTGVEFCELSMTVVVVEQGNSLYIPQGMFWAFVHIETDQYKKAVKLEQDTDESEDDDKEKSKLQLSPKSVAHACIFPLFVDSWLTDMEPNVRLCVNSMNLKALASNSTRTMRRDRAEFFKRVFNIVEPTK